MKEINYNVGVLELLGLTFVVLKLTNHIDWSWLWVTLPFWFAPALFGLMLIIYIIKENLWET